MNNKVKNTHLGLYIYHGVSLFFTVSMGLCMVLAFGMGMFADMAENDPDAPPTWFWMLFLGGMGFMFLIGIGFSLAGIIAVKKRTQWAWILQIVMVALGFGSIVTIVPCVFLLMGLISDEVQEYYKGS